MIRRLLVTLLSLAALGLMASGAAAAPAAQATTAAVGVKDSVFDPPAIAVAVGTAVTWTNSGALPHTVTADDASVDSGTLAAGTGTFSKTFDTAGTFAYHCTFHGSPGTGMAGTIIVVAAGSPVPVAVKDSVFAPTTLTITQGTAVTWTNSGALPHTVTADDASVDSGTLAAGTGTFSKTFDTAGTFAYHCTFHGSPGTGMAGTIIVKAPGT